MNIQIANAVKKLKTERASVLALLSAEYGKLAEKQAALAALLRELGGAAPTNGQANGHANGHTNGAGTNGAAVAALPASHNRETVKPKAGRPRSKRGRAVIAWLKAHPGSRLPDIAEHCGEPTPFVSVLLSRAYVRGEAKKSGAPKNYVWRWVGP